MPCGVAVADFVLQVQRDGHLQLASAAEEAEVFTVVEHHADFALAAGLRAVDVVCALKKFAGVGASRIWSVTEDEAFRCAFLVADAAREGDGTSGGAKNLRRDLAGVAFGVVRVGAFPAQKPGL